MLAFLKSHRRSAAIFALVFVAALGLRLHNLDLSGFWLDEIYQIDCTSRPVSEIWSKSPTNKPPLDYYIQSIFARNHPDEFHARLHACVFGAGVVALLGILGLIMGGWRLAWILIALSFSLPLLIRYSQEGRPYALLLLSETLFFVVLWRMIRGARPIKLRWFFALAGTVILCMWAHFVALTTCITSLVVVGIWILMKRETRSAAFAQMKKAKNILVLLAIAVVIAGAWVPLQHRVEKAAKEKFYAPYDTSKGWNGMVAPCLDIYACGYEWYQYRHGGHLILLALIGIGWAGWSARKDQGRSKALAANFFLIVFIVNFFGMFLVYRRMNHWMEMRYTIGALPPAIVLAGMGVESLFAACAWAVEKFGKLKNGQLALARNVLLGVICVAIAFGYGRYVVRHPFQKSDWRGVGMMLKESNAQGVTIICSDRTDMTALGHYIKRYGISANVMKTNFDTKLLEAGLVYYRNVWHATQTMGVKKPEYSKKLEAVGLRPVEPSFLYVDLRRPPTQKELVVSQELWRDPCPVLAEGWGAPQAMGVEIVRPMTGAQASVTFDCKKRRELNVVFVLQPADPKAKTEVSLVVNGTRLDAVPLHENWNVACWKLGKNVVKSGKNTLTVVPSVTPARDPKSGALLARDLKVIAWQK